MSLMGLVVILNTLPLRLKEPAPSQVQGDPAYPREPRFAASV